jgi:hypothetical protein
MAMKFLLVGPLRAARLAFCSKPFIASTKALLRPWGMLAITPSKCVRSVRVSRSESSKRERSAQAILNRPRFLGGSFLLED